MIVATMLSCKLFQEENQKTTKQGFYVIQPETLLDALAHEDTSAFVAISEQDVERPAPPTDFFVNWTQADYFYIVDAFYRLILQDTLVDWQVNSMGFSLRCIDIEAGLQDGIFGFFKIVRNEDNQEILITRYIEIAPRHKLVLLWEREFYPYVITRSSIDLTQIKFDSERVLEIAEDNGGQEKRLSLQNACSIRTSLSPDSAQYRGWSVVYTPSDNRTSGFHIIVDPFTGEIQ